MGVFARIMAGLAAEAPDNKTISIDATYLKAHPLSGSKCKACVRGGTASSLWVKKGGVDA